MPLTFDICDQGYQRINQGPMGYQCTKYGPCGCCSSIARGGRRKCLQEEKGMKKEKTTEHEENISAGFHPGIDK